MEVTDLVFIDETGYHFEDYPAFLDFIQQGYRNIYGADVYLESDSQDGQFLAILAKALYDTAALGASVFNSFSPVTGQGVGLSRNVKINGISRRIATKSTVELDIVGVAGTILNSAIAVDNIQQKWIIPDGTTIPFDGTITVVATAENEGATLAEPNTVTGIFTPTLGWQTVNNPDLAVPGAPVETDAQLRVRQAQSVAIPSLTVFDGTVGAVASLDGVLQTKGYENDTGSTDGNGVPPHSISIVVLGGDEDEIASTIATKKTPGCGTYGDTSVPTTDPKGMPITINFERPALALVTAQITLHAKTGWSVDFETQIAAAVAETINAFGIGEDVLLTRLYVPAYLSGTPAGETFDIVSIQLKKNAGAFAPSNVTIDWNEYPDCDPLTDIVFVVA